MDITVELTQAERFSLYQFIQDINDGFDQRGAAITSVNTAKLRRELRKFVNAENIEESEQPLPGRFWLDVGMVELGYTEDDCIKDGKSTEQGEEAVTAGMKKVTEHATKKDSIIDLVGRIEKGPIRAVWSDDLLDGLEKLKVALVAPKEAEKPKLAEAKAS